MALYKMALVKMDDFATTHSTGGVVERIITGDTELDTLAQSERSKPYEYAQEQIDNPDVYKLINCGDDVEAGWIYTDKTNVFVDSNSQA